MPKTLDSHFSIMSTNRALQPPLPAALRPYEDVMKLLAAFSGPNCEVVLHDLSDPVHSVVRVENGEVTGRAVGQGLRHLVPNLLRMPRTDDGGLSSESPNLLPVYWLRSRGRLIRALSLLIRDDAGEVVGVLCINQDVTNVSAAAGQLQALLALLPPGEASILPEASASADALASELCRRAFRGLKGDALQRFGSPQARIGISRLFGLRTAEKVKNTPKL